MMCIILTSIRTHSSIIHVIVIKRLTNPMLLAISKIIFFSEMSECESLKIMTLLCYLLIKSTI